MRVKRIEAVEAYIRQVGSVSIQDLCDEFHVSINTIRRDIDTLVRTGRVKKVYGGVVSLGQSESDATKPQTRELMVLFLYLEQEQPRVWVSEQSQ